MDNLVSNPKDMVAHYSAQSELAGHVLKRISSGDERAGCARLGAIRRNVELALSLDEVLSVEQRAQAELATKAQAVRNAHGVEGLCNFLRTQLFDGFVH